MCILKACHLHHWGKYQWKILQKYIYIWTWIHVINIIFFSITFSQFWPKTMRQVFLKCLHNETEGQHQILFTSHDLQSVFIWFLSCVPNSSPQLLILHQVIFTKMNLQIMQNLFSTEKYSLYKYSLLALQSMCTTCKPMHEFW